MTSDNTQKQPKRKYKKPGLRVLELAAKEVLAVGCKTDSGGFNSGVSPCTTGTCSSGSETS